MVNIFDLRDAGRQSVLDFWGGGGVHRSTNLGKDTNKFDLKSSINHKLLISTL